MFFEKIFRQLEKRKIDMFDIETLNKIREMEDAKEKLV